MELSINRETLLYGSARLDTGQASGTSEAYAQVRSRVVRGRRTPEGDLFPESPRTEGSGGRDVVTLSAHDVSTALEDGYLEVDGKRYRITPEAAKAIQTAWRQVEQLNASVQMKNMMQQNAYASQQSVEAAEKSAKDLQRAMKIFGRIASGGQVPMQDEKFLCDYSQTLYNAAKNMAMMAKEHKKYKTALEEEEEDGTTPPEDDDTVYKAEAAVSGEPMQTAEGGGGPTEAAAE